MKLKLSAENNVDILTSSEEITSKDISVLKAGITRLFQNGKNKIVFELPTTAQTTISEEVIRELGLLDNFARELSGRIVVVSANPNIMQRIQAFASPPIVLCHATRKEALAVFAAAPPLDAKVEPPIPAPPAPVAVAPATVPVTPAPAVKAPVEPPPVQAPKAVVPPPAAAGAPGAKAAAPVAADAPPELVGGLTKDAFLARELGDLGQIRKQLADAERENRVLQEQLVRVVVERRVSGDGEALHEKIKALELEVEKLLSAPPKSK